MPKIRLTNRTLLWVYDRYGDTGKSRRIRLHKSEVAEISEQTLRILTKRGIRFVVVDGDSKPEVKPGVVVDEPKDDTVVEKPQDEVVEEVKEEQPVETEAPTLTEVKKVNKKKAKNKKKSKKKNSGAK